MFRIFWAGLIAPPVLWILFLFTALFGLKFKWMILVFIGKSNRKAILVTT
jgi:hypothetical protein